jgi:hypothetical protein
VDTWLTQTIKWNAKNLESVHLGVVCVCVSPGASSLFYILYPNDNII